MQSPLELPEVQILSVSRIPKIRVGAPNIELSADSVIAMDLDSKTVLFEKNSRNRHPIASITKLMTAAVVLQENHFQDIVTVSSSAAATEGSRMGLHSGERITISQLLYGLLIESGNDSAMALAENNAGTIPNFVEKMNQKANDMGMKDTQFKNPTGLDAEGAYSSARDVSVLAMHLMSDPQIREIVRLKNAELKTVDGDTHMLKSTNLLLNEMGVAGIKTGSTDAAGECFVSYAISPEGHALVTVVLGSHQRFADTKNLLNWLYQNTEY